jgi:DNA (cytosine-5)-methyltransferase 1
MGFTEAFGPTQVCWTSDTDPDAATLLRHHYPAAPNLGDITTTDWRHAEPVDVIVAGIPCQAVSAAGRMQADADPRWLWTTGARIAIRALKPRLVVLENVRNLTSIHKGRIWRGILDDFRTLGYTVHWMIYGVCHSPVDGCHHRHRIFALAIRSTGDTAATHLAAAPCGLPSTVRITRDANDHRDGLLPTPNARDGDKRGMPSLAGLMRRINAGHNISLTDVVPLLPATATDSWGRYELAVGRWAERHGQPPAPVVFGPRGGRRFNPVFAEWMMGLPHGHVTHHVDRLAALRIIGNGVMPQQAAAALRLLSATLPSNTDSLTDTNGFASSGHGTRTMTHDGIRVPDPITDSRPGSPIRS